MIKLACVCGQRVSINDDQPGRAWKCPTCGAPNVVPPRSTPNPTVPLSAAPQSSATQQSGVDYGPLVDSCVERCDCGKVVRYTAEAGKHIDRHCPSCLRPLKGRAFYLDSVQLVHLIDAHMPFGSMVWLVMKWSFATIPTIIVFAIISAVIALVLKSM